MQINLPDPTYSEIFFCVDDNGTWFMKINKRGMFFNNDDYPNVKLNDAAIAFMKIIEKEYDIKFEKRKNDE